MFLLFTIVTSFNGLFSPNSSSGSSYDSKIICNTDDDIDITTTENTQSEDSSFLKDLNKSPHLSSVEESISINML